MSYIPPACHYYTFDENQSEKILFCPIMLHINLDCSQCQSWENIFVLNSCKPFVSTILVFKLSKMENTCWRRRRKLWVVLTHKAAHLYVCFCRRDCGRLVTWGERGGRTRDIRVGVPTSARHNRLRQRPKNGWNWSKPMELVRVIF